MAEYETIKSEEYKYGNNFIEIARKKVEDAEFISLSKGYYTRTGDKRYKAGIGFPAEEEIKEFFIKTLKEI
ncbi:hypothetical protein DRN74_00300 [Candidatus Micrarchaeota archaeon]|nr:MAG: hypothetical protein DRN74_00300 [Candidatus Micrarchaeota archaeon]